MVRVPSRISSSCTAKPSANSMATLPEPTVMVRDSASPSVLMRTAALAFRLRPLRPLTPATPWATRAYPASPKALRPAYRPSWPALIETPPKSALMLFRPTVKVLVAPVPFLVTAKLPAMRPKPSTATVTLLPDRTSPLASKLALSVPSRLRPASPLTLARPLIEPLRWLPFRKRLPLPPCRLTLAPPALTATSTPVALISQIRWPFSSLSSTILKAPDKRAAPKSMAPLTGISQRRSAMLISACLPLSTADSAIVRA